MPYLPAGAGTHPAFHFPAWHSAPECVVALVTGPTEVWIWCASCRVAVQLGAVSKKVDIDSSSEVFAAS